MVYWASPPLQTSILRLLRVDPALYLYSSPCRNSLEVTDKTFLPPKPLKELPLSIWEYFFSDPDKVLDANAIGRSEPSGYTCDRTQPMPTGDASLAKVKGRARDHNAPKF
ncbi:hypothetical protein TNCV_4838671 [Trichonephila clavipes]|nr:hypothetical protein TNCV_4838671 [Trichonephila clavipes]